MKLTIIPEDKLVIKDEYGIGNLDMSSIPSDVWAVQWDGTKGTIEKKDLSLTEISDISAYNDVIALYDAEYVKEPHPGYVAPAITTERYLKELRDNRNGFLVETDWTVMPDSPLSTSKQTEWKTYRQTLRDLPANVAEADYKNYWDREANVWPTQPS